MDKICSCCRKTFESSVRKVSLVPWKDGGGANWGDSRIFNLCDDCYKEAVAFLSGELVSRRRKD